MPMGQQAIEPLHAALLTLLGCQKDRWVHCTILSLGLLIRLPTTACRDTAEVQLLCSGIYRTATRLQQTFA